ncbi:hypothetical protein MTR67_004550 [Solanum verrucosum]|uniref:Uncharacterized protein n=1 Tax=Solanum verrucosum TaxID=315347 RepID=A0AAF0PWE7_SOLVR|nr:hypothetical protein MTR67_004550 [Solanum verrucosum]
MILLLFEMISGLEINLEKSSLFTVNGEQSLPRLGNVLSCQIGELPTEDLEMPLAARNCFDWEALRTALLLHDLEKVPLNEEVSDTILWMTQNTGHFSVYSCCKALNSEGGPEAQFGFGSNYRS